MKDYLEGNLPQLIVVSGPRRVGKTFLVQHALADLPSDVIPIYFEATQAGNVAEIRRFHATLLAALGPDTLPAGPSPADWEQALNLAAFAALRQRIVVVIDEATYLMSSNHAFASTVQAVWDSMTGRVAPPQLAVVLTGSSVGIVEDTLSTGGALYQRPTLHLAIRPLTHAEAYRFVGEPDPVAFLEAYAACGGFPLHLDRWDWQMDTAANLLALAGTAGGVLVEDGSLVLAGLSDAARRALIAVGHGRTKVSEISNEIGSRPERPLESLRRARLVVDTRPIGAPIKARPLYRVEEAYLRFWFRVLSNHIQQIEAGQGAAVLHNTAGLWYEHLGWSFEQAARRHAVRLERSGVLPSGTLVDEWWSTSGPQVQVDVLGLLDNRTVAVGEARWQARPLGAHEVDELAKKLGVVPQPVAQPLLLLWGRGGIRSDVDVGSVRGFGPGDMLRP